MVITRSHINEQISKGGKKMANGKTRTSIKSYKGLRGNPQGWKQLLPGMYDKVTGEKLTKEQRQRRLARKGWAKQKKGESAYTPSEKQAATSIKKAEKEAAKKKVPKTTPPILRAKKKTKKVDVTQKPLPEIKAKKKKTKSGPHMLFGGQKVRIPGRKGGGVVMQKVRKYNEGGVVVHDQSTIKNV